MFIKIIKLVSLLVVFGWAGVAGANLVDNGLTTFDTETGLEWLDITETTGLSYNEVLNSNYVVSEGYRFATEAELFELYANAGGTGTQPSTSLPENKAPAILLLQLMGCTSYLSGNPCDGVPEDWSPAMWGASSQYIGLIDDRTVTDGILSSQWVSYGNDDASFREDVGAFLVRPGIAPVAVSIPTISGFGIGLTILILLLFGRRSLYAAGRLQ